MNTTLNYSPNTLASIRVKQMHSIDRSVMHHILTENFYVAPAFKKHLSDYHLLYWSAGHTLQKINAGYIDGYIVIYYKCTRGQLLQLNRAQQVVLSFRAASPEFNLPAYVLVSLISKGNLNEII